MGIAHSTAFREIFPKKPTFSVHDIPDLTGKVVIVTGANTGIGKETAKALLEHNAKVYIACRSQGKADLAAKELEEQTGRKAIFLKLDLADLHSVKAAAEDFLSKEKALHILFNNAGVMWPDVAELTVQGYDLQFGTNVLGHFYFTKLLLPALILGAKSSSDGNARVVTSSSAAHLLARGLDFNTFKDSPARRNSFSSTLYCQSKFGNIVFANELARRYAEQGIVSMALHPGNIQSDLLRYSPRFFGVLAYLFMYSTVYGALTQLWGGTSPGGAQFSGQYLVPWARFGTPLPGTQDPELGQQLWKWAEEQVEPI